ncbi:MAG TPA: L,D-transpeptidase [Candidatus Eremiobacteraeota bacterium]|nr:MAG: hypothetical protein BWY64_02517 [bacterium ADurb.Bin363]HPZ08412.1 L,D-transpeptidase [Candidatus Eremiobacteraeota bacterium]
MKKLFCFSIILFFLSLQIAIASNYYPNVVFKFEKCIIIEIGKQRLHFYNLWGSFHKEFLCSTGAGETTPVMNTMVYAKVSCPVSAQYNARMPYWLEISSNGIYGIHALDLWENPYYLDYLGQPASHGCIRLSPENAKWLYEQVDVGVPVFVLYRK